MNVLGRIELAHEPDFVLSGLTVSPSRREVVRDDGEREVIEHRVMQVLIALSKAKGNIVTRDELITLCWDGRVVGEDAIHRVISRLRKLATGIGAGSIEIETITKIGYRLTSEEGSPEPAPAASEASFAPTRSTWLAKRRIAAAAAALGMALAVALFAAIYLGWSAAPVVAVGPGDSSPRSQRLARDLLVKLGTLPQLGAGHWQLVEASSGRSSPDLLFRATEAIPDGEPHTTLMLLDGQNDRLLWSREFSFPATREGDMRQHVSLTAARVLDCALEARKDRGLSPDLFRLFLNGCAGLAETSTEDPQIANANMRAIVGQQPGFAPAWARLLLLDSNILQLAENEGEEAAAARDTLRRDIEAARRVAPDLPEIQLAELDLLPPDRYADALEVLQTLKEKVPGKPEVWAAEANALSRVGFMEKAIVSSRRAAELDPLSPAASRGLIFSLAWGGATEAARDELERAERLWPGTGALRDAQFAFHLRYGDPRIAQRLTTSGGYVGNGNDPYLLARLDPSAANIDRMLAILERYKTRGNSPTLGYAVQALGEFHQVDEALDWLLRYPPETVADASYILFRPHLAEMRRDPRFMQVAKRIGLVEYWQKSGRWPDFCGDSSLPYDCRQEAARLRS